MAQTPYNLEESLGYVIGRAGRALANQLNQNFEKAGYDVTCEQWAILMNLVRKNGQSQTELASTSCKDKTSITRLLDGMEKRRLVVRRPDKNDGRHKFIHLTDKGNKLQQTLLKLVKKTLEEAQDGINVQKLETCKEVLRQIAQNLT